MAAVNFLACCHFGDSPCFYTPAFHVMWQLACNMSCRYFCIVWSELKTALLTTGTGNSVFVCIICSFSQHAASVIPFKLLFGQWLLHAALMQEISPQSLEIFTKVIPHTVTWWIQYDDLLYFIWMFTWYCLRKKTDKRRPVFRHCLIDRQLNWAGITGAFGTERTFLKIVVNWISTGMFSWSPVYRVTL